MEAQAVDQWPLGKQVQIKQHVSLQDRINAAKLFQTETNFQLRLLVDCMDNNFNTTYAAWPERAYIIHEKKMAYICDAGLDGGIDWEVGIESWLKDRYQQQ